jgi:hypothetical protein
MKREKGEEDASLSLLPSRNRWDGRQNGRFLLGFYV